MVIIMQNLLSFQEEWRLMIIRNVWQKGWLFKTIYPSGSSLLLFLKKKLPNLEISCE